MPRIRSIHPGLYTDEQFMELTVECPLAAILFTGIWCESDDDGVFDWKPLTLKARYLPAVNVEIADLLGALEEKDFVKPIEREGKNYGLVRNFRKYQRPKKPSSRGLLPDEFRTYVGLEEASSEPVGNRFGTGGEKSIQMERRREEGGERSGRGVSPSLRSGESAREPAKASKTEDRPPKPPPKRATRLDPEWRPPESGWRYATERLGDARAARELEKFRNYWPSQPGQRGLKLDWERTWRNWVLKAEESLPAAERRAIGNGHDPPRKPLSEAEKRKIRERRFRETGEWNEDWGPRPDERGTDDRGS